MVNWQALAASTVVKPGSKVDLAHDFDAAATDAELGKDGGVAALEQGKALMIELQDRFHARAERGLLICLQATDAAGKDGTVKHVMSGVNPEGVDVFGFKAPSSTDREHDWLWRHVPALPALGRWSVFNRSHYENVLVTRVHPELLWPASAALDPAKEWQRRYRAINDWEQYLADNGTTTIKLFLNVSYEEQGRRFLERIDDPEKNWKFSPADIHERGFWKEYQHAFQEMLTHTSTATAPWHVIPSDHKWYGHLCSFAVILEALRAADPHYPKVSQQVLDSLGVAKDELVKEGITDPSSPGHATHGDHHGHHSHGSSS